MIEVAPEELSEVSSQCLGYKVHFKNSICQDFPFIQYDNLVNRNWYIDLDQQVFYTNECRKNSKF